MYKQLERNNELIKSLLTQNINNNIYDEQTINLFNIIIDNNKYLSQCENITDNSDELTNSIWFKLLTFKYDKLKTLLDYTKANNNIEMFYAYCLICLLNENLTVDNIIELLNEKYIMFQWLGLYLSYNSNCHADDIIKLINLSIIHPYLALTIYGYQTPNDFIKLYKQYHNQPIPNYDGFIVEFGLQNIISSKPIKYINEIINNLPNIKTFDKPINVYYKDRLLCKHSTFYTSKTIPNKLINNIDDLAEYNKHYEENKNKYSVSFTKSLINKLSDNENTLTFINSVNQIMRYIINYWLMYGDREYNKYLLIDDFNPKTSNINQIKIPNIVIMDYNDNKFIIVKYLVDVINKTIK